LAVKVTKLGGAEVKLLSYARSTVGRPRRGRHGQSLVEFAMVVPLFFLLLFGIIDIGRVLFVQMTLQNAVRQAGRFAITGNHLTQGTNILSRVQSIAQIAQQAAVGLVLDPASIYINGQSSTNATATAGGPRTPVTVSLTAHLQIITPLIGKYFGPKGIYTFTVSTTFLNEPFPPDQT
jgi:Flp pilus assembly protein TadG